MNLFADESIDEPIVAALRGDGHTVFSIAKMKPGIEDDEVLALANAHHCTLLTSDKDFGELVYRAEACTPGSYLLRLAGLLTQRKAEMVRSAIKDHAKELINQFSVISPGVLRIRRS